MPKDAAQLDAQALGGAWSQLCSSGTASPTIASFLQVGLGPFLDAFERQYFGSTSQPQGSKLVLGMNGEGKTHLLYCLRDLALRHGRVVSLLDPKMAAVGESPFVFAQEILRRAETSELQDGDPDEKRIPALLRAAVQRKRDETVAKGLDPETILPRWADGFRNKDLHPFGLAAALADGLKAAVEDDPERLRDAAEKVAFEGIQLTKKQADIDGSHLLQSLPMVMRLLGFASLVILLDEAETAVEKKGSARRREFMKFLRFLNDHVAHQTDNRSPALVVIGCTDDFWPDQFAEYTALLSRLTDPGKDELAHRAGLNPQQLVRLNKVWVRETFRGDEADYLKLGAALIDLAARVHADLDARVQQANAERFARIASSDRVRRWVKRNFIKALCQEMESQVAAGAQRVIEEKDAERALDAAVQTIQHDDAGV